MTGPGYSPEDRDEVSDSPEIPDEPWAEARPLVAAMPGLVGAMARRRGTQRMPTTDPASLRLEEDVLARLRAGNGSV